MKRYKLLIFFVFFIVLKTAFAVAPIVDVFEITSEPINQTQFSWAITDDDGLSRITILEDGITIFTKKISGTHDIGLYQIREDGLKHTYMLIAYDEKNLTTIIKREIRADVIPPVVNASLSTTSKEKIFKFTTNEPAICKIGLSDSLEISDNLSFTKYHNVSLNFKEGLNRIFIKCSDQAGNEMEGFYIAEYIFDTIAPAQVTNIQYQKINGNKRLTWTAPKDISGITNYIIYNSIRPIVSVQSNFWDITTNDSIYYITAVDGAGNEGTKAEFNLKRELLLNEEINASQLVAEDVGKLPMLIIEENKPEKKKDYKEINIPAIAWSIFGTLVVIYIIWRVIEHKRDKHGLNTYLKQRKKLREGRAKFKI